MATKSAKIARPVVRRKRKRPATGKPKRNPWTRADGEIHCAGLKLGYARVSTLDQNLALQQDALKEAGCEKTYIEQMSGAVMDRPALREALNYARSGDTLIVWKLDRLTRSMKQLIETVEKLRLRGIGFRGLAEFERDLIHTRTSEGRERAKANGVKMGRKPKLTLRQKREAIRRRDKGNETTREIARSYNVSHSTISRLAV